MGFAILRVFSSAEHKDTTVLAKLLPYVDSKLPSLTAKGIALTLLSLSTLELYDKQIFQKLLSRRPWTAHNYGPVPCLKIVSALENFDHKADVAAVLDLLLIVSAQTFDRNLSSQEHQLLPRALQCLGESTLQNLETAAVLQILQLQAKSGTSNITLTSRLLAQKSTNASPNWNPRKLCILWTYFLVCIGTLCASKRHPR